MKDKLEFDAVQFKTRIRIVTCFVEAIFVSATRRRKDIKIQLCLSVPV